MATTTPPNLPGKENDTGFAMYNWLKRMRQWAIDNYNTIWSNFVLLTTPDYTSPQTLSGPYTFIQDPAHYTYVNFNTPVNFTGFITTFKNGEIHQKVGTTGDTLILTESDASFTLYDYINSKVIWYWDGVSFTLSTNATRIFADFGNATPASRTSFTPISNNNACHIQAIPTGTNTTSSYRASSTNDIANANIGSFGIASGTEVKIQSTIAGTVVTYIPITVYNGGIEVFRFETDGRISGTKIHNTGTVTGTTQQYIASGTYTPTATNVTNATAGTCEVAKWTRIGNVVSVSGRMALTPTAATTTTVWGLSLPIASNFASTADLNGIVNTSLLAAGDRCGTINADTTNDRANLSIRSSSTGSENYYYMYQYEVL